MSETSNFTNTIFKSDKISFDTKDDDYRFVKAVQNIKKGELLLVEHVYCSKNIKTMASVILSSPELFNNLYPRNIPWNVNILIEPTSEIWDLTYEKIEKNAFKTDDLFFIGLSTPIFNHASEPNSCVSSSVSIIEDTDVHSALQYVYSSQDISINEEVTIWYGSKRNNEFGGNNQEYNIPFKLENSVIRDTHLQYSKTEIYRQIMFNHICIYYGLYLINNKICPSPRFVEYFTDKIKKDCNEENIMEWMNEQKHKCSLEIKTIFG